MKTEEGLSVGLGLTRLPAYAREPSGAARVHRRAGQANEHDQQVRDQDFAEVRRIWCNNRSQPARLRPLEMKNPLSHGHSLQNKGLLNLVQLPD